MKRIPPSPSVTAIFAVQYIRTVIPGGMVFFVVTRLERAGRGNKAKGGMRYAFPPYERWAEAWGVRPNPVLAKAWEIISLTRAFPSDKI